MFACEDSEMVSPETYSCNLTYADNSASHPHSDLFQSAIDDMAKMTTGIQLAVTTPEGTWTGSSGMADIPNSVPLQSCHKLMIGSISKIYTGVLIMQLHEEGVLSVDDQLSDWIDASIVERIDNADEVTIRQLLFHMSGIREYLDVEHHVNAVNIPNFKKTQLEKLKYIYDLEAYEKPGEVYNYSNTNYVLLGLIVEEARNMALWDAVGLYITQPLGLQNSLMGTHEDPIPAGTARPYLAVRGEKYMDIMHYSVADAATGDGGIASNMQDLNAFIENLFNHNLINETTLQLMISDTADGSDAASYPEWPGEEYGLGIEIYHTPYGTAYGHTGSTSSYSSYLLHFPDQNVTISIAYNGYSETNDLEIENWILINDLLKIVFD